MYRIHFDADSGKFIIQTIGFFNLCWKTVKHSETKEIHYFTTYDEASQHIQTIGLDKLYPNRSHNQFVQQIQGYQPLVSNNKINYPIAPSQV